MIYERSEKPARPQQEWQDNKSVGLTCRENCYTLETPQGQQLRWPEDVGVTTLLGLQAQHTTTQIKERKTLTKQI
jgi:hypothetical protein